MAFDAFVLMLAMLALGMLLTRLRALPDNAPEVLNLLVIYVCLPAAILIHVPQLRFDVSLVGLAVLPWAIAAASWMLLRLLTLRWHIRRDEYAVLLLCTMLGNTSFVGYPMIAALLGEPAVRYAVVYDQFGTFLLLSTVGLVILARHGGDRQPTTREIAWRVLRFPPVWALLFGLTLMPEQPPRWIADALRQLADVLLMLAMLTVGLTIQLRLPRDEFGPLAVGLSMKLLLLPLLSLPLAWLFGMRDSLQMTAVLETAMPPMITASALAISHGLAPRLAAAMVGYGIVLSMLTLPGWTMVLQRIID